MTEDKRGKRGSILHMIGVILVFGAPYVVLILDRVHIASPGTGILPAALVLAVGLVTIYLSGKRVGMGD